MSTKVLSLRAMVSITSVSPWWRPTYSPTRTAYQDWLRIFRIGHVEIDALDLLIALKGDHFPGRLHEADRREARSS
jgi:hypothetical protein